MLRDSRLENKSLAVSTHVREREPNHPVAFTTPCDTLRFRLYHSGL
jgi:hypothetical protein